MGAALHFFIDGNVLGDCNGEGMPDDYDGHSEYALGGAWFLSCEDACGSTCSGSGAWDCFSEHAHHVFYGPFLVEDVTLGQTAPYFVAIDDITPTPSVDGIECGDGEVDQITACVGICWVTFGPGLDGSYHVFVGKPDTPATLGHASLPSCSADVDGSPSILHFSFSVGAGTSRPGGQTSPC